jgi:hypothetical protein
MEEKLIITDARIQIFEIQTNQTNQTRQSFFNKILRQTIVATLVLSFLYCCGRVSDKVVCFQNNYRLCDDSSVIMMPFYIILGVAWVIVITTGLIILHRIFHALVFLLSLCPCFLEKSNPKNLEKSNPKNLEKSNPKNLETSNPKNLEKSNPKNLETSNSKI